MVQPLDAGLACVAMNCPRWSVNSATPTVFHPKDMRFDTHIVLFVDKSIFTLFHLAYVQWNIVTLWSVCCNFRHDSRVNKWKSKHDAGFDDVKGYCDDF